jgi:hypothetical protein
MTDIPVEQQQDEREPAIEPTISEPPYDDPVTRRQTDPAAMSEHERNQRLNEIYDGQPADDREGRDVTL